MKTEAEIRAASDTIGRYALRADSKYPFSLCVCILSALRWVIGDEADPSFYFEELLTKARAGEKAGLQ